MPTQRVIDHRDAAPWGCGRRGADPSGARRGVRGRGGTPRAARGDWHPDRPPMLRSAAPPCPRRRTALTSWA